MSRWNQASVYLTRILLWLLRNLRNSSVKYKTSNTRHTLDLKFGLSDLSISIATFEDRFFAHALPLIEQIRRECDVPIVLVINGNLDRAINPILLSNFISAAVKFGNVFPVTFHTFHGCAKLWNTGILHGDREITLVLNDDIGIIPGELFSHLVQIVNLTEQSGLIKINESWSHFAISKQLINKLGWFDERFLGIGEEDGDYQLRFHEFFGSHVRSERVMSFVNLVDPSRDSSVARGVGKYSLFNRSLVSHPKFKRLTVEGARQIYPYWRWRQDNLIQLRESNPQLLDEVFERVIG